MSLVHAGRLWGLKNIAGVPPTAKLPTEPQLRTPTNPQLRALSSSRFPGGPLRLINHLRIDFLSQTEGREIILATCFS